MWENYEKIKKLGEGGMGEVWLVSHKETRGLFASKYLKSNVGRDKDLIRFKRELNALKKLNHENIIRLVDISEDPSMPGYIMEYCPDGDLYRSKTKLDTLEIIRQLSEAVRYLHQNNLIHRDIKPHNILFSPSGTIRLSDFGLVIEDNTDRTIVTTSNWVSYGFAPPEQYENMATVKKSGDIFSIGAVLYYLLKDKTFNIAEDFQDQIKEFKGIYKIILENTLAKNPNERYQDADAISKLLSVTNKKFRNYFLLNTVKKEKEINSIYETCFSEKNRLFPIYDKLTEAQDLFRDILQYEKDTDILSLLNGMINDIEYIIQDLIAEAIQQNPAN